MFIDICRFLADLLVFVKFMLSKLFGSQARVKILKIFLLNPDNKYYIRQLARDLNLQVNSVRRELENLEKFGLLISDISKEDDAAEREEIARENKEFEELASGKLIFKEEKEEAIEDKKKAKIKKVSASNGQEKKYYKANPNFILLEELKALMLKSQILYEKEFAEKLKNIGKPQLLVLTGFFVNNPSSSVDILAAGSINRSAFSKLVKELEKEIGRELNYTLMDNKELKNRREMTDVFLFSVLEGKRVVVIDELGISG